MITRIEPRSRESIALITTAARDDDSDMRYLATLALGNVSLLARRPAERELADALTDRNLRVRAAAAVAIECLRTAAARSRIQTQTVATTVPAATIAVPPAATAVDDTTAVDEVAAAEPAANAPPQPVESPSRPAPRPSHSASKDYDVDEQTVEERKGIGQLRARITPSEGDIPIDHAGLHFALEPVYYHGYGMARGWYDLSFAWCPPGVCHRPLYFQDLNLERYGYHYGCAQTLVSSLKFGVDAALLPYKVCAEPPCECVYTLGYDRPGNCVPYRCYRLPWRTDAAMVLGGVAVGLFFLAPP
jgi:hypothetical protein